MVSTQKKDLWCLVFFVLCYFYTFFPFSTVKISTFIHVYTQFTVYLVPLSSSPVGYVTSFTFPRRRAQQRACLKGGISAVYGQCCVGSDRRNILRKGNNWWKHSDSYSEASIKYHNV
jgi:dolichyl-phosphate-mannose--protein O-mannosyl transferase